MDTSNTIDFLVTGQLAELSRDEWAMLIWRMVHEVSPSFEYFLGFRPLHEFHDRAANGTMRSFVPGYLTCPVSATETYCKELTVLVATSWDKVGDARSEHFHVRSLLITRKAQFLLQNLMYSTTYTAESTTQEVTCCAVCVLDFEAFAMLLRCGDSTCYGKVIDSIVALAGDTWGRRQKMVEKDLETYKKLQAISGRVSSLS